MTKKSNKPNKPRAKIKAPRKAAVVRDSDLAQLAAQFQDVADKIETLLVGYEERLSTLELKLDALVHLSAPPERDENEDARPNGLLRPHPRKSRISLFEP